jgi:hypothetical protein
MTQQSNGEGETKVMNAYQNFLKAIDDHNYRWRYKKRLQTRKPKSTIGQKRTKILSSRSWVYSTKFGTKDREFAEFVKNF